MTRTERCLICGGTEFVDAVDNDGESYRGCAKCVVTLPDAARGALARINAREAIERQPRFSLRKLVAAQQRINEVAGDPSFVHPFTAEQLAMMSFALGVLSAERIAAGETLDDDPEVPA